MPAFWPAADWGSGIGFSAQVQFAQLWTKIGVRTCAAALLLALIGRPRFIVLIAVASLATATFWLMSTIPLIERIKCIGVVTSPFHSLTGAGGGFE